MGSDILHSSIGLASKKYTAVQIYVIPRYERFVKIWNLAKLLLENLFDLSYNAWMR